MKTEKPCKKCYISGGICGALPETAECRKIRFTKAEAFIDSLKESAKFVCGIVILLASLAFIIYTVHVQCF